jgi:hypothetical protein
MISTDNKEYLKSINYRVFKIKVINWNILSIGDILEMV